MAAYIFRGETRNLWPCGVFISTGFHRDRRFNPALFRSSDLNPPVYGRTHTSRDVDGTALAAGLANNQQQ